MLPMKVYVCGKTSLNRAPIQISAFKHQKPGTLYLIGPGDHGKTIQVIKVIRVKCAPITGIAKGMVMVYLLVRYG